jgi:diketogulonate reductase-like aldo/keto reductase
VHVHQVPLPDGELVDSIGLGTWRLGESARRRTTEVAAVRRAFELGYRLVDTAEMYGEGGAEEVIGQALAEAVRAGDVQRDEIFIVSKVYPHNASRAGVVAACERSLRRLGLDRIDLYLLHWRGGHPLTATVSGFEALRAQGRIRHWGVSNFDVAPMAELWRVRGGRACAGNQVYYSLGQRGVEFDLIPWQREHRVPLMAYCPIDQGVLAGSKSLVPLARRLGATPAQIALAWLSARGDVIAIPKAVREEHLRENLAAASITLDGEALAELDRLFPPPRRKRAMAII